jgi:general secretion pathway protein D
MIKSPPASSIAALLGAALIAQPTLPMIAGDGNYQGGSSAQTAVSRELARRQDYAHRGEQALEAAKRAMADKDYETAVSQYKLACDLIPNASNSHALYAEALSGFCRASVRYAEQRIAEGRYADAQTQLKVVLDDRYNPRCKDAVVILSRLETPDYYNQTIGPKFRGKVEEVKKFHSDARGFEETGRYDLAMKRTDQILADDKYNIAARQRQEDINLKRTQYAEVAYNETRSRMLWQVQNAWQSPVRRFNVQESITIDNNNDAAGTARINAKLQKIIIPKLELREATIVEALEFLKKKSTELDNDPDQQRRGVSFVLKLEGGTGGSAPPPAAAPAPAAPAIPGLEAIPGAAPAAAPLSIPAPTVAGVSPADARISVALTNIPLIEALKYVTSLANLKYKVEPYAVAIVPVGTNTLELIQKEYKVPPGFITRIASPSGEAGALAPPPPGGGGGDASGAGRSITGRVDAVEFLKSAGVTFPEGATAVYLPLNSRLLVRNTQENLDLIDKLVELSVTSGPTQVEIEAKFVEITQQNLKELSFDWLLGAANVPGSQKIFSAGGTSGNTPASNASDFPFIVPGGGPVGGNPVTGGNRSGNLAINANAIDSLLFGVTGASAVAPGVMSLAGVFTDPAFQLVIRALDQKKGVDLLSAPRVTTKSGNRAVIEIIREFRYPTEFEPPQIPQNFGNGQNNGGGGGAGAVVVNLPGSFPVTPTTPTAFETRNTGVTLEVEPTVGPDGYTIDLNLVPQVVEFEGFINYGSPITSSGINLLTGAPTQTVITPNVINQPIFSTRKVTTSVSVFDGQTVVLGGLMREDVQKVQDKTPFLGDIPLIGRLFRSNVDQHLKRNLVIFVSARLMNPAGEPVRLDEEAEEEVVPQPPPEATSPLPELPLMPKN